MIWRSAIFFLLASVVCAAVSLYLDRRLTDKPHISGEDISRNLEKNLARIEAEAHTILTNQSGSWSDLTHSFFLFQRGEVVAWSTHDFVPDMRWVQERFTIKLIQVASGDFLLKKWLVTDDKFLIAVIPLHRKYPVVNRYLSPQYNAEIFGSLEFKINDIYLQGGVPILLDGRELFRVEPIVGSARANNIWMLVLVSGAFIFLIAACVLLLYRLHQNRKYEWVFFLSTILLFGIRTIVVAIDFPVRWYSSNVFDPQKFASSSYNSSIGDMVLNSLSVLTLCIYLFFTYSRWRVTKRVIQSKSTSRWLLTFFSLIITIFSFLYPFLFFETIFHNSDIPLDITNTIQFDWLRVLAYLSILLGTISAFLFVHVFVRISKILTTERWRFLGAMVLASCVFIVYFISAGRDYWITLGMVWVYVALLFETRALTSVGRLTYQTFLYTFLAVGVFGLQGALSINRFANEERLESQLKFGASYLLDRDVLAEYLLNESANRIANDAFIQSRILNPFLGRGAIRQKIKQVYLNAYFDRYDSKVYLYNSSGGSFDEQSPPGLAEFIQQLPANAIRTEYDGVYFIKSTAFESIKRYVAVVPLTRFEQVIGFVVLDLSLKRIIPQNVYPELLVDSRFSQYFENRDKSFAFINEQHIQSSFGNFNYERDFDFSLMSHPTFFTSGVKRHGFWHIGVEDDSGQVAVVTSQAYPAFFLLTNFSFLFVIGLCSLLVWVIAYRLRAWQKGEQLNYAARIQLYIYLAFALPLLVVTFTTLNRISNSAEDQLNQDFQNKSRMLGENLLPALTSFLENPSVQISELEEELVSLAKLSGMDVTIYNPAGKNIASSQPLIVESHLTSYLMNREVWERISLEGEQSMIRNEQIGSLRFNNSYFGLKSPESGKLMGVLSVPFFESAFSLESTQINVLANILTVFTLIFILFSVLSFYAVNALTFPLRFITRTLSRTTFSGENKPLEWKAHDEIGLMVTEYNRMVENLEQSKIELARNQKEHAWREIAKQVAHEIKNPLTPMKLTLQQLEQLIRDKNLSEERAFKSVNTLLNQVEILNEIASSFSAFARMPAPILQRVDLVSTIKKSVDLYANNEWGNVTHDTWPTPIFIMGDDQLLNRIFSNIILNGLQSGSESDVQVHVSIYKDVSSVILTFRDNGMGIDQELSKKVFTPYFSTKQSGSGLGLAIAKQGIEQSGGEIWFDTEPGKGTRFYIKLPFLNSD